MSLGRAWLVIGWGFGSWCFWGLVLSDVVLQGRAGLGWVGGCLLEWGLCIYFGIWFYLLTIMIKI